MRVLLFTACMLFGSVSCLIGNNSSEAKRKGVVPDEEHFFKELCGDTDAYRAWKNEQNYNRYYNPSSSPSPFVYRMDANNWRHENKAKLGTMASMLDQPYEKMDALGRVKKIRDVAIPGAYHKWQQKTRDGESLLMVDDKTMRWFRTNRLSVSCTEFKNDFPMLDFHAVPGFPNGLEIAEENTKGFRFWRFVGLADGTVTLISASETDNCKRTDKTLEKCASLLRFDSRGNFHRDIIVDGMPVPIIGKLWRIPGYHHM